MKTRIEYVERLTGKLKGCRGVVFEETPQLVHLIDVDNYVHEEIDGEDYAPFTRAAEEYRTLSPAKPDIKVGDKLLYKGTGEVVTVKQITLGKVMRDEWYVITDDTGLRSPVDMFEPVEPSEPMTIYTVYYRHFNSNEVTGVEMNARNIQHAIESVFEWIKEMDDLEPEEIDICHVEVTNA